MTPSSDTNLVNDLSQFKLAIDNSAEHVVITDPDGLILYANKAVEQITGFPIEEIMGQKAGNRDLWGGNMGLDLYKKFWHKIKVEKKKFEGVLNNHRKNGEHYYAKVTVTPVLDEGDNVVCFIGNEADVTSDMTVGSPAAKTLAKLRSLKLAITMLLNTEMQQLNSQQQKLVTQIDKDCQTIINQIDATSMINHTIKVFNI